MAAFVLADPDESNVTRIQEMTDDTPPVKAGDMVWLGSLGTFAFAECFVSGRRMSIYIGQIVKIDPSLNGCAYGDWLQQTSLQSASEGYLAWRSFGKGGAGLTPSVGMYILRPHGDILDEQTLIWMFDGTEISFDAYTKLPLSQVLTCFSLYKWNRTVAGGQQGQAKVCKVVPRQASTGACGAILQYELASGGMESRFLPTGAFAPLSDGPPPVYRSLGLPPEPFVDEEFLQVTIVNFFGCSSLMVVS